MDSRQEPSPPGTPAEAVTNNRVDRVYGPAPREPRESRESASQVASALLATRRNAHRTTPPVPQAADTSEVELSLRRQLSRLQRQLAEAQRELANKDDELAVEVEKRLQTVTATEEMIAERHELQDRLDQLTAYEARTTGIEQRLQDANATADEMAQFLEREREHRIAAQARLDEVTVSFDETRTLWNAERAMLEEHTAAEVAQLRAESAAALADAEETFTAATTRMRESHEAELAGLRSAHERSLSTLRGELEPRALEARSLAEDRERLASKVVALEAEATRLEAERDEEHGRALAQLASANAIEIASMARAHAADLARSAGEKDAHILTLQQAARSVEARHQTLEESNAALQKTQLRLSRDVAEAKERAAQLEAELRAAEERLAAMTTSHAALVEEVRVVREQLEASAGEARRNALDRLRFVAYLEEGLALLGALPPAPETPATDKVEPGTGT